ncbi:MAG: succinate dehydrogenase assembly factor 2 [Amphiplicatus sp.]
MSDIQNNRRKRLLYQAQHRGFKEADLMIGGFAAAHLAGMSESELDEFEALLAFPDHDLYAWITGGGNAPANVAGPVLENMRAFDVSLITAP